MSDMIQHYATELSDYTGCEGFFAPDQVADRLIRSLDEPEMKAKFSPEERAERKAAIKVALVRL